MPEYTHLQDVPVTEKAQAVLQDWARRLQSAHFRSFGSYEICEETDSFDRQFTDFILEFGRTWAKVLSNALSCELKGTPAKRCKAECRNPHDSRAIYKLDEITYSKRVRHTHSAFYT